MPRFSMSMIKIQRKIDLMLGNISVPLQIDFDKDLDVKL